MEHITPLTRNILNLANKEAKRLGHNIIGVEHIFIGLARDKDGPAGVILRDLGFHFYKLEIFIKRLPMKRYVSKSTKEALSPSVARVFEQAFSEANRQGQSKLNTLYLLLGIMYLQPSRVDKLLHRPYGNEMDPILKEFKVTREQIIERINYVIQGE